MLLGRLTVVDKGVAGTPTYRCKGNLEAQEVQAHRLVQRFTASSPSPEYVSGVAQAFSQGHFGCAVCSGARGDSKATVAAILLHSEAREQRPEAQGGLLREPMIKTMHFTRAMEHSGRWSTGAARRADWMSS